MRNSILGDPGKLTLLYLAFYGLNAFAQYSGDAAAVRNGSLFAGYPAPVADSVVLHGSEPFDPPPAPDSSENAAHSFNLEDRTGAFGPVSVAELQHPLSNKGRSLILKAQLDLRKGHFDPCFADLDKAMKINSAIPYAHGVRGAAYLLLGRYADAISELQQAVQVLPLPAIYSNLAYAHVLNGDAEQAEQDLHQALQRSNAPPQARYLMGLLLLDRKPQNTEACQELERAQNLMPAVHAALAVCYQRGGQVDAASVQIRDFLGPANQSKFELWKKWVAAVATRPHPSSAFGLRLQPGTSGELH